MTTRTKNSGTSFKEKRDAVLLAVATLVVIYGILSGPFQKRHDYGLYFSGIVVGKRTMSLETDEGTIRCAVLLVRKNDGERLRVWVTFDDYERAIAGFRVESTRDGLEFFPPSPGDSGIVTRVESPQ